MTVARPKSIFTVTFVINGFAFWYRRPTGMTVSRFFLTAIAALAVSGPGIAQTIERVRLTDNELSCTQIHAEVQQMDGMMQLAGSMTPVHVPQAPQPVAQPQTQLSAIQQAVLNHPNNVNLSAEQKAMLLAQTGMAESRGNAAVAGLYGGAQTANALRGAVVADPGVQAAMARARAAGLSEAQIAATLGMGVQQGGLGALGGLAGLLPGLGQMAAAPAAPAANVAAGQAHAQAGGLAGMLGAAMAAQGAGTGLGGNTAGLAGMFGALANSLTSQQAAAPPTAPVVLPTQTPPGAGMQAQAQARKEHLTSLFLSRGCKMSDVRK